MKNMNVKPTFFVLLVAGIYTFALVCNLPAQTNGKPSEIVAKALGAMGGSKKLQDLKTLRIKMNGHLFLLEQSERPAGPWLVSYEQTTETRDLETGAIRRETVTRDPLGSESALTTVIADGAVAAKSGAAFGPLDTSQVGDAVETIALAPERVLLTALEAKDLRLEKSEILQDVRHNVISFIWKNSPVKIFLNADTSLPTAVEIVRAHPFDVFWNIWGDFPTRTYFSFWTLESNGMRYPHQWDVFRNDQPLRSLTIFGFEINPKVAPDAFTIPYKVKKASETYGAKMVNQWDLGSPNAPAKEIATDFVQVQGNWNIAIIKQSDGIVILESPISSGYSAKVIEEAQRRFPNFPIKAVISTSDAFPHIGGLREYLGRGIPAYILDVNQPLVERLLHSEYRTFPDALAKNGRRAKLKIVKEKTVVGTGANRLELYPIRTETGERMMMVYAPERKLLYGSDLVQPQPDDTFFMPEYITELVDAANREGLQPESVFAMHSSPIPWSNLKKVVEPK